MCSAQDNSNSHTCAAEVDEEFSSMKFGGHGDWLDDADLAKKYEGKPDQLASVMANAQQMWCPHRSTMLFKDVTYTSHHETGSSNVKRVANRTTQEDSRAYKPPKKIRPEQHETPDAAAKKRKPLTETHRKKWSSLAIISRPSLRTARPCWGRSKRRRPSR